MSEAMLVLMRVITPGNEEPLLVSNPPYGSIPREGDVITLEVNGPKYQVKRIERLYDHDPGHSFLVNVHVFVEPLGE